MSKDPALNVKQRLEAILKLHNVNLFEFVQTGDHEYTLRTEEPASPDLQREMDNLLPAVFAVRYGLLKLPPGYKKEEQQSLPGLEAPSVVNHPKHYNSGKIEVIEYIEDQRLSYHLGNAVKYISRAGKKDPAKEIEDLEKAEWYLKRALEIKRAARDSKEPKRPNDMNPRTGKKVDLEDPAVQMQLSTHRFTGDWIEVEHDGKDRVAFMVEEYEGEALREQNVFTNPMGLDIWAHFDNEKKEVRDGKLGNK